MGTNWQSELESCTTLRQVYAVMQAAGADKAVDLDGYIDLIKREERVLRRIEAAHRQGP